MSPRSSRGGMRRRAAGGARPARAMRRTRRSGEAAGPECDRRLLTS